MLFEAPLIPGLAYREELIDEQLEARLIAAINRLELSPFRFQGWTGKRLTRTFGWSYDFDDRNFACADPLPQFLEPLIDRASAFSALDRAEFRHALVTRYDPGAGIGWHRDRPQFGAVVGVSLAGPAVLRFRRRSGAGFTRTILELGRRSAYLLSGEVRDGWEHSIASHHALRFSITLRTLSARGMAAATAPPG